MSAPTAVVVGVGAERGRLTVEFWTRSPQGKRPWVEMGRVKPHGAGDFCRTEMAIR